MNREVKILFWIITIFICIYFMPLGSDRFGSAIFEALYLVQWYAREHVLLCLIPAFFIAGAIGAFINKNAIMTYLGPGANRIISYGVSSVSGTILAVCSCTVLPLFAGIYRMGAGLGPATTFLYAGPAINVMAIILTARILGVELGVARALGAILFSIVIGLCMHFLFRKEELNRLEQKMHLPEEHSSRSLWQNALYFAVMVLILVFANWAKAEETTGIWYTIYSYKWVITGVLGIGFGIILYLWFDFSWQLILFVSGVTASSTLLFPSVAEIPFTIVIAGISVILVRSTGEKREWLEQTWDFAKQILPLLLAGVFIAGALLGRPGNEGLIPTEWVHSLLGDNSLSSNFFASIAGAFMYFATLTEVPIVQGLMGSGMGKGPALALLLAGPALSLPNMLVIRSILGTKKTIIFICLVVLLSAFCGIIFGRINSF